MLRRVGLLTLVVAFVAAGCGGGGGGGNTGVFDVSSFSVTFEYPLDLFDLSTSIRVAESAGSPADARAGIALDNDNVIIVSRYDLRVSISKDNIGQFKGEVDNVISELAGKKVSGAEIEYGGLPGYEYAIDLDQPADGRSRLAVLFDGDVEYLLNCQSTPPQRETLEEACQQALDTLKTKT